MKAIQKHIIYIFCLFVCLFLLHATKANKIKQALKYLNRGEFNKVEEIVLKSLQKESINPAAKYIYSILYSTADFYNYNIDSARIFILVALEEYVVLDEKHITALEKTGILFSDLEQRKATIQLLAFQQVLVMNSIDGYNLFLTQNKGALQFNEAVKKRDSLAFLQSQKQHTWQAYKTYLEKYPESENYQRAKTLYQDLIFQSKTSSGKLIDLQKFIKEHPQSPYKNRIEHEAFSIISASGNSTSILNFINKYQNQSLIRKGINILYHLDETSKNEVLKQKGTSYQVVLDSITKATELDDEVLFPILEDNKYLFINFSGEQIIKGNFDKIATKYFCGNITADVLDVTDNGKHKLINRQGSLIYEGQFKSVVDIGNGILKIYSNGKYKAFHKSGFIISNEEFDDISMVRDRLIKVKKNEFVGLISITGRKICPVIYDNIYTLNDYWVFEKNKKIGLLSYEDIIKEADNEELNLILKYQEAELIDNQYLICFVEDKEVLFDQNLKEVVPQGVQKINTQFDTWTIKQALGYRVFNKEHGELIDTLYDNLFQNEEWLALKKNRKWSLYKKRINDMLMIGLDSVKLIGNDIAMVFRGMSRMVIFPNKKTVKFTPQDLLYSIGNSSKSNAHYLVINIKGNNSLYRDGKLLFTVNYDKIGYISDNAFYVKKNGKYGAVGSNGKLIMHIRYDAIIEAQNEIAPVLYRGKFGAYNFRDKILIKLDYDKKLKAYNDQLLICKLDGKDGLISIDNKDILTSIYDEIKYWTDSIALTRTGNEWAFTAIYSEENIYEYILDYTVLEETKEATILKIRTATGYGIYDIKTGLIINPVFSDIVNINTFECPLYFCEKSVPEGNYYIAIYKNEQGKTIRSQAYRSEEYERIVCE